jgi:signal transduction histidine kinase
MGDSEMAVRIRSFDWAATPLGPLTGWSRSLRSAVAVCLHSRFQMAIYWGPRLTCIYNDAEREVLAELHPGALGMPAQELLRDSWDVVGPQLEAVIDHGDATWAEDQPLSFDRRGILETGYFTYSYSPILDDDGAIGGVLLVTQETTARVLAERRLDVLRELALRSMDAPSAREACRLVAQALRGRAELEFFLVYLISEDGARAECIAGSGRAGRPNASAGAVELNALDAVAALFRDLAATRQQSILIDADLLPVFDPAGLRMASRALVTTISRGSADPVDGFLVAGIDAFALDKSYRHFVEMVGLGLGRSVAAARAREGERARTRSLAALEEAKSALFSNASHELRTPLSLILGPLEQVLEDMSVPGSAREQVALARRSASRMLKIVNGLLDFSRIEAGERIGAFLPTDLPRLTRDVGGMFESAARKAGLRLSLDCPPLTRAVDIDREAWENIVSNLLSNALKFTPSGSILVQVRARSDHAVLTVTDTGIGIAAEDLDRIFSRFYRVEDPRARAHEGTGLGLALVRELVRMHGGSVSAESTAGQGTTIVVNVPFRHKPDPTAEGRTGNGSRPGVGASAAAFVEEVDGWLGRESSNGTGAVETRSADASVLLVEDNRDMRDYLRRLLASVYSVRVAVNGTDAYRMAIDDPPSVVISDVMMPGADGFRLLHDLRSDSRTRDLPVILVSARADPESTLEALQLGADDYLVKPFGARELLTRIRATLQSARLRSADAEARGRAQERALARGELQSLLNDLKAAQRRIAAARDAERRRIERNLHDGAQQRLMAIRLELGLVSERLELDPAAAQSQLDRLRGDLDEALEELRELAHGLYPPLLASDGLRAALAAAARHAVIPVDIDAADFPRQPHAIENAAYFCCLEALQNAAKHAGEGIRATVRLAVREGVLEFLVSDDGVGFDREAVLDGYGLTNLADRVQTLGGEVVVTSLPGQGTTVTGQLPLP